MTQKFTILFDLDGTLIDTAPDLISAHNHVMQKYGHNKKQLSDIKTLAGRGAWVMMQRSFKKEIKAVSSVIKPSVGFKAGITTPASYRSFAFKFMFLKTFLELSFSTYFSASILIEIKDDFLTH